MFAWVADSVNCQWVCRGYLRASSSATQIDSSVGSRNCVERAARSCTARTIAGSPWPQNADRSLALKSR